MIAAEAPVKEETFAVVAETVGATTSVVAAKFLNTPVDCVARNEIADGADDV